MRSAVRHGLALANEMPFDRRGLVLALTAGVVGLPARPRRRGTSIDESGFVPIGGFSQ